VENHISTDKADEEEI
jgi:hypothetical protein